MISILIIDYIFIKKKQFFFDLLMKYKHLEILIKKVFIIFCLKTEYLTDL